jgi:hypothetical protein
MNVHYLIMAEMPKRVAVNVLNGSVFMQNGVLMKVNTIESISSLLSLYVSVADAVAHAERCMNL